jgi:hypothetical protein
MNEAGRLNIIPAGNHFRFSAGMAHAVFFYLRLRAKDFQRHIAQ